MSTLHRAQIYLEEEQIQRLKVEAKRERLAVSELIRLAIDRFLQKKDKSVDWDKDPFSKAIGSIKLNSSDVSVEHDHYVYGTPRRNKKHG